jgi:hypothetical protein
MSAPSVAASFTDRLRSAALMGAREYGGRTILEPSQLFTSPSAPYYASPYRLKLHASWATVTAGFDAPPWRLWQDEADPAYFHDASSWYAAPAYAAIPAESQQRGGSLLRGPGARKYPPPTPPPSGATAWQRQRLVALAASMVGYPYRRHHIPDWHPDASWYAGLALPSGDLVSQWIGQGVDCGDYASWLYSYGLGLYLDSNTHVQGGLWSTSPILDNNDGTATYRARKVDDALAAMNAGAGYRGAFSVLRNTLQTGDLLYIAGDTPTTEILALLKASETTTLQRLLTHVLVWLGDTGLSPDDRPLVTDSYSRGAVTDAKGAAIPDGVQVRPFSPPSSAAPPAISTPPGHPSWYFDHFVWAQRILPARPGRTGRRPTAPAI